MGFIGLNACLHYAKRGFSVVAFDNLSRATARKNHKEFSKLSRSGIRFIQGDARKPADLDRVFRRHGRFDLVLHLAGQTAVTTSVIEPRTDFESNALGTFNMLETVRRRSPQSCLFFASTNKVYGGMDWLRFKDSGRRYQLTHPKNGVSESAPLDFHSPYGCSKGSADQYVRDYARIYGLKTVVFRQSCIYGPWQYGEEDQGWVAWFALAALSGRPITLFGNGKQVRDVLFVDDLLSVYDLAQRRIQRVRGEVYNIGGGPKLTLSLLELLDWIGRRLDLSPKIRRTGWRPGDQKAYVSDISKARRELGWAPNVSVGAGLEKLLAWLEPRFAKR